MIVFLSELYNEFGNFGPIILFFLSMFFLWNRDNLFFYYIVGIFSNSILNLILKGLIQQPRPSEDIKQFNLALTHGKRFLFKDGIPHDIFGMPSGHSQSSLFSTVFVYLSLRNNKLLYIYLIISLITITQRVVYDYHTILQVIAGSLVGGSFGYFVYYLAREKIKGHITEKLDDYGPI
jgi:membrane-associated phospholipid phosphatase